MTLNGDSHLLDWEKAPPVRRRLAVLLLVCLAVPAAALAAAGDPKERFTSADQAKARSIVLKKTDFVAGWKRGTSTDNDSDLTCPGFDPDGSDLTL